MARLPDDLDSAVLLADWLELSALEAGDGNSSAGDLTSALQIASVDGENELVVQDTMRELERRKRAAGGAYPFSVRHPSVLQYDRSWRECVPYIFCLCLSHFVRWVEPGEALRARKLFEELAAMAAEQYIGGESMLFGRECERGTEPFRRAVDILCNHLREGGGYKPRSRKQVKDDKLDIVAWKPFNDGWPSQLVMFGQCATGKNWTGKVSEMQPERFWDLWLTDAHVSPLLRSFYIPYRVQWDDWIYPATYAGVLFECCRIAFWAQKARDRFTTDQRFADWCISVFPALG